MIFLPPREHEPPHVHVRHSHGEVVIELETGRTPQRICEISGMRANDVAAAFWIVEEHAEYLMACWREFHG